MSATAPSDADAPRLRVLLLCDDHPGHAANLLDHIAAIRDRSRHHVTVLNVRNRRVGLLDLREFDVVIVHWSLALIHDTYVHPDLRRRIAEFTGTKIVYIQDEYRWVDRVCETLVDLGVDVLFTCTPPSTVEDLYDPILGRVRVLPTLTGYVPDGLGALPVPPIRERGVDVGYRTRIPPFWLGRLAYEKVRIGEQMLTVCRAHGLRADISCLESERLYGSAWTRFLTDCRTSLGSESGASIVDRDGRVERAVQEYLASRPNASFADVERDVLGPFEGNLVMGVVSPRIFEAVALRTPLILYPGSYSGVVEPWRHYIPLEKDLSNAAEVVERVRDDAFLEELAERAYEEIVSSGRWSLRTMVADLDDAIDGLAIERARRLPVTTVAVRVQLAGRELAYGAAGRTLDLIQFARYLIGRRPLRKLALALVTSRRAWGRPASTVRELWTVCLAHLIEAGPTPTLRASLEVHEERRKGEWRLVTVASAADGDGRARLRAAFANGEVKRVAWRPPAGAVVPVAAPFAVLRFAPVPRAEEEGAVLDLLPTLGARVRTPLADALVPEPRPERRIQEFVVATPVVYVKTWLYALAAFALAWCAESRVRPLIRGYLGRRRYRAEVAPDLVARDALLCAFLTGSSPGRLRDAGGHPVYVAAETPAANELRFVTRSTPSANAVVDPRAAVSVGWRNEVGSRLRGRVGPLRVPLREAPIRLESFSVLLRRLPEEARMALPAAPNLDGAPRDDAVEDERRAAAPAASGGRRP